MTCASLYESRLLAMASLQLPRILFVACALALALSVGYYAYHYVLVSAQVLRWGLY